MCLRNVTDTFFQCLLFLFLFVVEITETKPLHVDESRKGRKENRSGFFFLSEAKIYRRQCDSFLFSANISLIRLDHIQPFFSERERETERERERERQRQRDRERERERQRERQIERYRERETETDRERQREIDRETETEREVYLLPFYCLQLTSSQDQGVQKYDQLSITHNDMYKSCSYHRVT